MKEVFFSIIIPTYNRGSFIKRTIESVINQTYTNFEVIVVDDGSTDNTFDIIEQIKDNRLLYFKKNNEERGAARNYGVNRSKGNYITFLDSDDLFYPNHLEKANDMVNDLGDENVFFINFEFVNSDGDRLKSNKKIETTINEELINGNILSCHGVFLPRQIALYNKFNEDRELAGSEDYELWLRIASQHKIFHSNDITHALVEHNERSVISNIEVEKLNKRCSLLLQYLFNNEQFLKKYGKYKKQISSQLLSYISLHLSLVGSNRLTSLNYLLKSIWKYPPSIFRRRFLGILKNLI